MKEEECFPCTVYMRDRSKNFVVEVNSQINVFNRFII